MLEGGMLRNKEAYCYGDRGYRFSNLGNYSRLELHRMCCTIIPCSNPNEYSFVYDTAPYEPSCPLLVPQVKTSSAVQHTDAVLHAATPRTVLFLIAPEIFRGVA